MPAQACHTINNREALAVQEVTTRELTGHFQSLAVKIGFYIWLHMGQNSDPNVSFSKCDSNSASVFFSFALTCYWAAFLPSEPYLVKRIVSGFLQKEATVYFRIQQTSKQRISKCKASSSMYFIYESAYTHFWCSLFNIRMVFKPHSRWLIFFSSSVSLLTVLFCLPFSQPMF